MKILTLGKLARSKDDVKATVEKLGGKLTGTASKATLCISTKSEWPPALRPCSAAPGRGEDGGGEAEVTQPVTRAAWLLCSRGRTAAGMPGALLCALDGRVRSFYTHQRLRLLFLLTTWLCKGVAGLLPRQTFAA